MKQFSKKAARLLGSLLSCILLCVSNGQAQETKLWSRGFDWTVNKDSPAFRFMLFNVNQERAELTGEFSYDNYAVADEVRASVVIRGERTKDGRFWANVDCEVRKDSSSPWEAVRVNARKGYKDSVVIKPLKSRLDLFVSLERFKQYIGVYESARVTLPTGDKAEFQLKSLMPPSETR